MLIFKVCVILWTAYVFTRKDQQIQTQDETLEELLVNSLVQYDLQRLLENTDQQLDDTEKEMILSQLYQRAFNAVQILKQAQPELLVSDETLRQAFLEAINIMRNL